MRKRMLPIARRERSKRRIRPRRRKAAPGVDVSGVGGGWIGLDAWLVWVWVVVVRCGAYLPPLQKATPISVWNCQ